MAGAALAALLMATPAAGQPMVDGDTIRLDGAIYRIWGIDAPERRQACADGWSAGAEANRKMAELVAGRTITCEPRDKDRFGRIVALCRADGQDLGAAMVRAGMAWAFTRYSSDYVEQEKAAVGARRGVHAHDCEKPWDWRARNR
jgi:endonuclease YncB( thermonuclease family)